MALRQALRYEGVLRQFIKIHEPVGMHLEHDFTKTNPLYGNSVILWLV